MKIIFLYAVGILFFFSAFSGGSIGMKKVNLFIAIMLFVWSYIEMEMVTVRNHGELKRKMVEQLKKIPHTVSFIAPDYLSALLLDNKTETFYMIHKNKKETELEIKAVPFLQIYEVAIEEDKKIVSFISKSGLLGGSLLSKDSNSVVYIVETKEEKEKEEEKDDGVSKLSLKLVVDDLSNPIVEYVFMESDEPLSKESDEYKEVFKKCNEWHQKISVIIKRYEKEILPVHSWM